MVGRGGQTKNSYFLWLNVSGRLLKSVNSLAPKSTASARPVLIEEIEAMAGPIKKVQQEQGTVGKEQKFLSESVFYGLLDSGPGTKTLH